MNRQFVYLSPILVYTFKIVRNLLKKSPKLSLKARAKTEPIFSFVQIQSFYLIADDIMDNSETRRGKPCWFRREGVGMSAINDAFIMDSFVEDILRLALPGHVNLDRLCEAYRKSKQKTLIGQVRRWNFGIFEKKSPKNLGKRAKNRFYVEK